MDRLSDEQISAVLDGTADAALVEAVKRHPELAAQVEMARNFEVALRSVLHRWDCPSLDGDRDQHVGSLVRPGCQPRLGDCADRFAAPERMGVARHLELCVRCRDELALLTNFLDDEHAASSVPDRLPEPAMLPPRWHEVRMQPSAPADSEAWRGAHEATSYVLEAQGLTLFIEHDEQSPRSQLNGQLVTEDPSAQGHWRGALAELRHDGNIVTTQLDELGEFTFDTIQESELLSLRITNESGLTVVWTRASG